MAKSFPDRSAVEWFWTTLKGAECTKVTYRVVRLRQTRRAMRSRDPTRHIRPQLSASIPFSSAASSISRSGLSNTSPSPPTHTVHTASPPPQAPASELPQFPSCFIETQATPPPQRACGRVCHRGISVLTGTGLQASNLRVRVQVGAFNLTAGFSTTRNAVEEDREGDAGDLVVSDKVLVFVRATAEI